jgi:hypothetical protein
MRTVTTSSDKAAVEDQTIHDHTSRQYNAVKIPHNYVAVQFKLLNETQP